MSLEARRRYPLAKVKGGWSPAEDAVLKRLVEEHGEGNWSVIARHLNASTGKPSESGRIGKQCRERFNHHLRPDIKKDAWTEEEEELLVVAHLRYGNRWSDIARHIQGRTENSVKNHWNATLRRKDGDKCGGRSGPPPQSCVLRDYMVRIALLSGSASGPEPGSPVCADPPTAAPDLPVPLLHDNAAAPVATTAADAAPRSHPDAARSDGAVPAGVGEAEQQRKRARSWAVTPVMEADAGPSSSPCSSTSTHAGLGVHCGSGGRDVEGPAASASVEQEAAQAPERKRPRIITFAAAPSFAATSPQLRAQRPRSLHAAEAASRQRTAASSGHGVAKADRRGQEPALRAQLQSQFLPYPQHRQHHWASDSAEDSMYGSPVSERFGLPTGCGVDEAAELEPYDSELASSSEVQAAQIMLALRSLTGVA